MAHTTNPSHSDFPQLKGEVYLDHAGATLYSATQMNEVMSLLMGQCMGNPHTSGGASERTATVVQRARERVLAAFGTDEAAYTVVFTVTLRDYQSGATAAIKLAGDLTDWSVPGQELRYTTHSHTSVLGLRELAADKGAAVTCIDPPLTGIRPPSSAAASVWSSFASPVISVVPSTTASPSPPPGLFVFAGECNFSGVKNDLSLVGVLEDGTADPGSASPRRWRVLLDAAKLAATTPIDLSSVCPSFVALSFYKMFGYPTGLGALLIRNDVLPSLSKRYFGGGTVTAATADTPFVERRPPASGAAFEDGTSSFLSIAALDAGFNALDRAGGLPTISARMHGLTQRLYTRLAGLRHSPTQPVCVFYGNHAANAVDQQGPVVTFNVLQPDGTFVSPGEIGRLFALHSISVRTGCFCNPGACQRYLGMTEADVRRNLDAGYACWGGNDLVDGNPVGAVRASLGYMTKPSDVDAAVDALQAFIVDAPLLDLEEVSVTAPTAPSSSEAVAFPLPSLPVVSSIVLYPIKSCRGISVDTWPLGPRGLLFDREWCVADLRGSALTQKTAPRLALVIPELVLPASPDSTVAQLVLRADGLPDTVTVDLPLVTGTEAPPPPSSLHKSINVCGQSCHAVLYADASAVVNDWFSKVLDRPVCLVRAMGDKPRHSAPPAGPPTSPSPSRAIGFANEAQFLMVSQASVASLREAVVQRALDRGLDPAGSPLVDHHFFRPNLVIGGDGLEPYAEDSWTAVEVDGVPFVVTGSCQRCRMINIDQTTGEDLPRAEPLLTLSKTRRTKAGVFFGRFLGTALCDGAAKPPSTWVWLSVGATVKPQR